MFPRLPARATFVAGTQKMFLILFRNILCSQQMFPSLRSPRNIMGNNVSSFASGVSRAMHRGASKTKLLVPVHLGLPLFSKSHCDTCVPERVILNWIEQRAHYLLSFLLACASRNRLRRK